MKAVECDDDAIFLLQPRFSCSGERLSYPARREVRANMLCDVARTFNYGEARMGGETGKGKTERKGLTQGHSSIWATRYRYTNAHLSCLSPCLFPLALRVSPHSKRRVVLLVYFSALLPAAAHLQFMAFFLPPKDTVISIPMQLAHFISRCTSLSFVMLCLTGQARHRMAGRL